MNDWSYHAQAVVEADDWQDRYDRNGINFLFWWKSKYPKFKITLFTIPSLTSEPLLKLARDNSDWIELAVHGWNHESNFECYGWDYEKTSIYLERVEKMGIYKKIFKAPGWSIIPGYNGYPAPDSVLGKDPTAVYRALQDRDYRVVDRHYNAPGRPKDMEVVCIDDSPIIVHMHTWNVPSPDRNGRNGFGDVEEIHGVPWDHETQFYFISEGIEQNLFNKCSMVKDYI